MRNFRILAILSVVSAAAYGGAIVSPGPQAAAEGNGNNAFPFDIALVSLSSMRYQQVYGSSDFTGFGTIQITQIAFRPDVLGAAFSSSLPDIQINMSTTSTAVDGLSNTFASNVGGNDTVVYARGSLALSSSDTGPVGGPKAFDIVVTLTTPFLYNPSLGNLLLDVRNFGGGSSTIFDAQDTLGDAVSRALSSGVSAATADSTDSVGLVTQFTFTSAVPEPSALLLSAGGLLVLAIFRWRIRRA